jgi:hypothetical protein
MGALRLRGSAANMINEALKKGVRPETWGKWAIYGEDENCDLGGSHSEPFIGNFEGTLRSAALHAWSLPRFKSWGGGGYIERIEIDHGNCAVTEDPVRGAVERIKALREQLEAAEADFKTLTRTIEARKTCMDKLKPILKSLTNDEMNVAIEVFTGLVKDYTE